jgi:hypothetical protein
MKKINLKRSISTLLISGFLIGVPATASLAQSIGNTTTKTTPSITQNSQRQNRQQFNIKPTLDKLVKAKTITAAQETKIITFETKKNAARPSFRN